MLGIIPLRGVLALRHDLAVAQVHHLDGLLVRGQVLVVAVGEHDLRDAVGEIRRQVRGGQQLVLDLLAGVDNLAVDRILVATLARLADHVLLHRRDITADVRFVRGHGVLVHGLGALVRQGRVRRVPGGVRGRAERQLRAGLLAEVLTHLFGAAAVREVDLAGQEQGDLEGLVQALQGLAVLLLRAGGRLGAVDGDVEVLGHVPAVVDDVRDAGLVVGGRLGGVHAHVLGVGRPVPDVVRRAPVVRDLELLGRFDQVRAHGRVDHAGDLVPVKELLRVGAGRVGLLRVDHGLPFAVRVLRDPGLVGVGLPGRELLGVGRRLGLLVPLHGRGVLHLDEILGRVHGHVERELVLMLQGHLALVGRAHGGHGVRRLVPADREITAHVLAGGRVGQRVVRDLVVHAVRLDHVLDGHLVTALAGARGDRGAVGHRVGAHALLDLLHRGGRRDLAHGQRLARVTVRGIHRGLHLALLRHLHVHPDVPGGPMLPPEITGTEQINGGIAAVGERDLLAPGLRGHVRVAVEMDDRGAGQVLLDRRAVVARVDHVRDPVGRADLQRRRARQVR